MKKDKTSKRFSGYKDVTVHDLAVSTPVESLNIMSEDNQLNHQTKPELQPRRSLNPVTGGSRISTVVPVVALDGTPLMPCSPAKAKKLIRGGVATKCFNKLGMFYIKMQIETGKKVQTVAVFLDPGSKFDGLVVVTKEKIITSMMLELPSGIAKKLENRSTMRRARRFRNCRRRPCRFDNRKRPDGWIAPSQKSKVDFRIVVFNELFKIYPISNSIVEDVRFDHYNKRWGKHFSTVEIGKTMLEDYLKERTELTLYQGFETSEKRKELGLKKTSSKSKRCIESHVTDAVAMACKYFDNSNVSVPEFYVVKLPELRRRSLHLQQPAKGGTRRVHGGTVSQGIKKNSVVIWKGKMVRTGGSYNGRTSVHDMSLDCKRIAQNAKKEEFVYLYHQRIFCERRSGVFSPR